MFRLENFGPLANQWTVWFDRIEVMGFDTGL
jgi:hypothetical protein